MNIQQILIQELHNEATTRFGHTPSISLNPCCEIPPYFNSKYTTGFRIINYQITLDDHIRILIWNEQPFAAHFASEEDYTITKIPIEDPDLIEKIWSFIENQ